MRGRFYHRSYEIRHTEEKANQVLVMEKFAGYGFNDPRLALSPSTSLAFKTHYPTIIFFQDYVELFWQWLHCRCIADGL